MIDKVISDEEIALLANLFTQEEVEQALKQMKGRKSSGLDNLQA